MMRLEVGGGGVDLMGNPKTSTVHTNQKMSASDSSQLAEYFSHLFDKTQMDFTALRKDKKKHKKHKKSSKVKDKRKLETMTELYPTLPQVQIPRNPSPFAVFAAIRATCLENQQRQASLLQLQTATAWNELVESENDLSSEETSQKMNLPKIVGIGLQSVLEIISESQTNFPTVCKRALRSLLDILQGLQPEELSNEPSHIMEPMFNTLLTLASSHDNTDRDDGLHIRALACACLLCFAVALGDTGKLLQATSTLLMSPRGYGSEQIIMPSILVALQRSTVSVMLGKTDQPDLMSQGVTRTSVVDCFPLVKSKTTDVKIFSFVSDGSYLYMLSNQGLLKVGTGYSGTIKGHIYVHKTDFHCTETCWIGYCNGALYYKSDPEVDGAAAAVQELELMKVTIDTLDITECCSPREKFPHPYVVFSDGNLLGLVTLSSGDNFVIKYLSPKTNPMNCVSELPLKLARKCVDVFGASIFEDCENHQVDFGIDDESVALQTGKDFALMLSTQGRLYFTGKASSLGHKQPCPPGQWNEICLTKSPRITQFAVGHEGQHALLLSEDGVVYFTGSARRGEDGDQSKARRQPKPVKPKKLDRMFGIPATQVACNNGSSVIVSKDGEVYIFGKDSTHTDYSTGQVPELKGIHIIQAAVGKAHVVVLSLEGQVYTFGMNNKGQCGREFPPPKDPQTIPSTTPMLSEGGEEASDHDIEAEHEGTPIDGICPPGRHKWKHDQCMVCAVCGECTGYGPSCVSSGRPDRNPGMFCGCGSGDSGCAECGCCRGCAGEFGSASDNIADLAGAAEEAALAVAGGAVPVRDLIRLDLLAASGQAALDYKRPPSPHGHYRERIIRRRLQESARRSRRYTKKDGGSKARVTAAVAAAAVAEGASGDDAWKQLNPKYVVDFRNKDNSAASDLDKDPSGKLASLPPAKVNLPKGVEITQIACGLHHTVMLTRQGDVFTFGSNTLGQLGVGDLIPRGCPSMVAMPKNSGKAVSVAAGSFHSVVLTDSGQVLTFGSHQKGQLGRGEAGDPEEQSMAAKELWFARPGTIPNIGSRFGRSATWIGASADQTFIKVDESLINAQSLLGASILANKHYILLLPPEHQSPIRSLVISKIDGFCRSFAGPEQIDFRHLSANIDPLFDVVWSYDNKENLITAYHPSMSDIKEKVSSCDAFQTILSPELALPMCPSHLISRNQASLNLLSCLDILTFLPNVTVIGGEDESVRSGAQKVYTREDFSVVNRFDSHGGGWGYSGHSIEAIRFMTDADILLGGFGLFGGRGEYIGKIKLFDIGIEGSEQEIDGDLLAESEEITYECGARQKYPILFDEPIPLQSGRWYVAWARVSGPSSDCGSSGQEQVITEDQIQFNFKSSKKSNNGTDVNAGQIPQLLYRIVAAESQSSNRRLLEQPEPIYILTNRFARTVSAECFQALLSLLQWAWAAFKAGLGSFLDNDMMSQPIILDMQRLIFICRACMRLIVAYTEVVYPNKLPASPVTKPVPETQKLAECIYDVRKLLQQILSDPLPFLNGFKSKASTSRSKNTSEKQLKICQDMLSSILADAHKTFVSCFHAFYPTGYLKWACLCNLLAAVKLSANNSTNYDRLLTAVLDSLCNPMIKLRNTFPITYSPEAETRCKNLSPTENISVTTSMIQTSDSVASQRFPVLTELMNYQSHVDGIRFGSWSFREVLDRLLAIAAQPVKQQLKGEAVSHSHDLVEKSCEVVSSVISELANQTTSSEADLQSIGGRILHVTPNRFTRTSNSRTWNTGNGSPDAICFSVDKPGVFVVGACVYGGMGTYDYELELLDDQSASEKDHGGQSQRWNSLEIAHGSYSSDDCVSDIAELKFERAVAIRPNVKYALRLRNHGGRTSNGDGGLSTVKGPDGTSFTFTSCSLSFNGTNPTRGQLPQILYFSSPQESEVQSSTKSLAEMYSRRTALSMTATIVKTVNGLLIQARDSVDDKGLEILNSAPIITKLMPHIFASISSLAVIDPPSAVQVLTFIQDMLPSVAALNNLSKMAADAGQDESTDGTQEGSSSVQHYAWIESDHPYKPAAVNHFRVTFPSTVRWMSLEFDPRCSTAQSEDVLQIYIANPTSQNNNGAGRVQVTTELETHFQKYVPVLKRFSGGPSANWPKHSVVLPGSEVLFSLETASDYIKDDKANRFGFRCLAIGYEGNGRKEDGLKNLEKELAYLGGICSASLMKRNICLSIPALEDMDEELEFVEESAGESFAMHSSLLSKGFALDHPPNIHQALDGVVPFSCQSNERLFLKNFVHCVPNTSGERLARWLQPESYVDVDQCKVLFANDDMRCNWPTIITVVTRDQYGETVQVPNMKVEVKAVPIDDLNPASRFRKATEVDAMTFGGHAPPNLDQKYEVTVKDKMFYHAITIQKTYDNYSFEELRFASPTVQRQSENMLVRPNNDGTYSANWTPGNVGSYQLHVTIDGASLQEVFKVEVRDPPQGVPPPHQGNKKQCETGQPFHQLRKFIAKPSAGLRIRVHPTLQSEQIGVIPVDGTVSIVDELHNSDGVWVRIGHEALMEYASPNYTEGWCLQYNQHLGKTLLVPVVEPKEPSGSSRSTAEPEGPILPNQGHAKRKAIKAAGPGTYTVVKCGASGHNIRSNPNLSAAPIGMLNFGDTIIVTEIRDIMGELWVKLDQETVEQKCFTADGDAWSLAMNNTGVVYLENKMDKDDKEFPKPTKHARIVDGAHKPVVAPRSPRGMAAAASTSFESPPVPSPRQSLRGSDRGRTPSPSGPDGRKPSFFQKLFKAGETTRRASASPPPARKHYVNKDIPPELVGVSVKELVKVIGESRANGNGVTPPGTPAVMRRSSRSASPQVSRSSRSSSPISATTMPTVAKSPVGKSPLSQSPHSDALAAGLTRQNSSTSDTSALVSSIAHDFSSQSGHEGSASPVSLRSEQMISIECPFKPSDSMKTSKHTTSSTQTSPEPASKHDQHVFLNDAASISMTSMQHSATSMKSSATSLGSTTTTKKQKEKIATLVDLEKCVNQLRGPGPVKEAISPSVAESVRSVFAAFIWHEGIVHDTMAAASFLKFHPNMTKQGSANTAGDPPMTDDEKDIAREQKRKQRHSVEVTSTAYLKPHHQDPVEKSAMNANTNRNIRPEVRQIIPENGPPMDSDLPQTLHQIVILWEEIRNYCIHAIMQQIIVANPLHMHAGARKESKDKDRKAKKSRKKASPAPAAAQPVPVERKNSNTELPGFSKQQQQQQPAAVAAASASVMPTIEKEAFCQLCEMCSHYFPHPVTYHMRISHPGCGSHAGGKGYNSGGNYCGGWAGSCGDGGVGGSSWYLICEKCRDGYIKNTSLKVGGSKEGTLMRSKSKSRKSKLTSPGSGQLTSSHIIMNNNAVFLLDLASSASNSNLVNNANNASTTKKSSIMNLSAVSELTPLDPNPFPLVPFQCFQALGVQDSHLKLINDELVLDEALRRSDESSTIKEMEDSAKISPPEQFQNDFPEQKGKKPFCRSVSIGGSPSMRRSESPTNDLESGTRKRNSSCEQRESFDFLSNPSPSLQKLFSSNGSRLLVDILQRPVMSFVLQLNDLESLQIAMNLALRKAACRSFAMQALNWLLRSVSQPACLHDLLWCFAAALDVEPIKEPPAKADVARTETKDPVGLYDHPISDISIAGEAISPLPETFHSLLQTVADLMLLLPVGSSLQQIAITCWGVKFQTTDHQFLHQSHVFSTISKILSRSEELDNAVATQTAAATNNSFVCDSEGSVSKFLDLTPSVEIKVSSRQAMSGSLTDNSTETFWESGDEDRNKSKWITITSPAGLGGKLKNIAIHVDNCRDLGNKVSSIVFKSGKNFDDLHTVKQTEVESRFAGWLLCFFNEVHDTHFKLELKGPDNSLRLRQVKVLGPMDEPSSSAQQEHLSCSRTLEPCSIQQRNCEAETLRVFRLLTSQVFGRLLEENNRDAQAAKSEIDQESYLKEHMVGILFSRSKLTHLQKQVCTHIVQAIKTEASRLRDDWEVSLCSGVAINPEDIGSSPDTYCFEMLSLVLALSGSNVGRTYLAQQAGLIEDLLTLLHTGTARIQRQVIALLRRILSELHPKKFARIMGVLSLPPKDFGILTSAASRSSDGSGSEVFFDPKKPGILDVFLSCIAKSLTLQVKAKEQKDAGGKVMTTVSLASRVHPRTDLGARWWLRGSLSKKIAEDIIFLLKDMSSGKLSEEWAHVTKSAIAENILSLTRLEEEQRDASECLKLPVLWLALASLCVLDKDHVEGLSSGEWNGMGDGVNPRPTCDNHDDSETLAMIICDSCGNLCGDCDRFLHLHRRTKSHQRQVFKEEEDAIKVDLHEGCGRTKLFWIMALADSLTLKALVEFRERSRTKAVTSNNVTTCRFCGRQNASTGSISVIDNVCTDPECVEYARAACSKVLTCGHFCGGIAGEQTCMPCLHGCTPGIVLKQDADDMCMVCFTEALYPIPSIMLSCGHVFHYNCCKKILENRWIGPRITFGFRNCPICKVRIQHEELKEYIDPIDSLYDDVMKKALMRLEYEGLSKCEAIVTRGTRFYNNPAGYALERYAYYVCFKCKKAYFGGEAQCDQDAGGGDEYNPEELVCGGCSDVSQAQMCPKHGTDYLEYKCRYCCSVAVFFCFGTTHFCNACHDDFQRVANVPKPELPQCPVGPKATPLEGEECPLHVKHPPTGEEFALGCGVCRNAHTF